MKKERKSKKDYLCIIRKLKTKKGASYYTQVNIDPLDFVKKPSQGVVP